MMDWKDFCFSYSGVCAELSVNGPGFGGTADTEIKLRVPGVRGTAPDLAVKWNFGGMNVFGRGVSLSLPYFERMTAGGVPAYDTSDSFIHPRYGVIQAGTAGNPARCYPRADYGRSRIEYLPDTDAFRETLRDGTVIWYEEKEAGQSGTGFVYFPTKQADPRGMTIRFRYRDTGEIASVEYGDMPGGGYAFVIDFSYEPRPDREISFRGGFPYARRLRCSVITVSSVFTEKRKMREIAFSYDNTTGYSLLNRITETAFSGGEKDAAPSIRISYGEMGEAVFTDITSSFAGVDMGAAVPVSLCREGASGLFVKHSSGASYSPPVWADGPAPRFGPKVSFACLPGSFSGNDPGVTGRRAAGSFFDLDGDGGIQRLAPGGDGYYEIRDGQFGPFTPFESICPAGAATEFADIYGDGRQSAFTVLSTGEGAGCEICRGLGKKGFGRPRTVRLPKGFPAISPLKTEYIGFVRFFGDGLQHRIALRDKSCVVFPNLGNGQFGDGIRVGNAPDFGGEFDAERVRFADTTGSGTDDIIYIGRRQVMVYQNIAGAFFEAPFAAELPEPFAPSDIVYAADFTGDLLPQLIFIKRASSGTRVYSLRFAHRFLINGLENGLGLDVKTEYASSAAFRLKDAASGRPWSSAPPLHIPVVTGIISLDGVTDGRSEAHYSYRDGRYIRSSRALYGFGSVCETRSDAAPLPEDVPGDLQPPVRRVTNEYYICGSEEPPSDELALIGLPLTTSFAGEDGAARLRHTRTYRAKRLKGAPDGSYFPALVEEETALCGKDPRVSRTYMAYDDDGNMTVSETHFLPLKSAGAPAGQSTEYISKETWDYISIDTNDTYIKSIIFKHTHYTGKNGGRLALASLREYYYADPASGQALPAGVCALPALPHHSRDMVCSAGEPDLAGLEDVLLNECGCCLENGCYYISNEACGYDADHFFRLCSVTLGSRVTSLSYDDSGIFVTGIEQSSPDGVSLAETYAPDYASCAYQSKTDWNGNTQYYLHDGFGELRALSYRAAMTPIPGPHSLAEFLSRPQDWLAGCTDAYIYHDRNAWENARAAACRAAAVRKEMREDKSASGGPGLTLSVSYTDSHGRGYGQAVRDTDHWIISERAVYAGEMKLLEYPPCHSGDPDGGPDGYPTAYRYDLFGRIVKVYTPYSEPSPVWRSVETEYEPWYVRTTDARLVPDAKEPGRALRFRQDLDPRGLAITDVYEEPCGSADAAGGDTAGRDVTGKDAAVRDVLRAQIERDSSGNVASLSDGRLAAAGFHNLSYRYDRLGRVIKTFSADAGETLKLYGHEGRLIYEDSNGTVKRYSYDALGRFISLSVQAGKAKPVTAEQIVWGEGAPEAEARNLRGRVWQRTDRSGTTACAGYDRFGRALDVERHYAKGGEVRARYSYNLAGELKTAETGPFSLAYSYSPAGKLMTVSTAEGERLSSFSYNAQGNVCDEACPGGLHAFQSYDPVTRFLAARSARYGGALLCKTEYHFTAQGNLAAAAYEALGRDPLAGAYTYDVHSRLIHARMSQGAFQADESHAGRLHSNETSVRETLSENMHKDELYADPPYVDETYEYDNSGNIISFTRTGNILPSVTRSFEIAADSNRIEAAVINGLRCVFSYHAHGGPERLANGQSASYDEFGRLSAVAGEKISEEYVYDARGKRAVKTDSAGTRTVYFTGNPLAGDYTRQSGGCEMLKLSFGGMLNTVLLKSDTEAETLRQVTDQRGSVILTLDRAGNLLLHEAFSPYGEAIADETGGGMQETPAPALYRFAGREYDRATGLCYLGARYYSPEDGRMITPDDAAYAFPGGLSGLNLYAYCLDNPETFEDISGNFPSWIRAAGHFLSSVCTVSGAVGGAVTAALGVSLGRYFNAIDPFRATAVAAFSSAAGAFISAGGGVGERLISAAVTGAEAGLYTAAINYGKEALFKRFPGLARERPAAAGYAVTGINAAAFVFTGNVPGGMTVPKVIGALGGGELGVAGALYSGETGTLTNPRTEGGAIRVVNQATHYQPEAGPLLPSGKYDMGRIAQYGVVDFSFYRNAGGRFQAAQGAANNYTEHRVIEYNASEASQWSAPQDMADMMELCYYDSHPNNQYATADLAVIVHGGPGGHVFIDGDAPLAGNVPVSHTFVHAETLANDIAQRIGMNPLPPGSLIKLINCHGGEYRPIVGTTAQRIADRTGMRVAAYDGAVSIYETLPYQANTRIARMFYPH